MMQPAESQTLGVVVDLTDHFFRVPCEPHLLSGVAGTRQTKHPCVLFVGESFSRDRQAAPGSVERVVASAAMSARLVLHATSALIERPVGELRNVERVGDLGGVREHRVEHDPIRRRQIQRRPLDPIQPLLRAFGEPPARLGC
jgi:hypothetical protein